MSSFDVVIIGAGIAGASLAAELAPSASVALVEGEEGAGYHATGRSAALFHGAYGGPGVQPLSLASLAAFRCPPPGFAEHPILTPRGILVIATTDQEAQLDAQRRQAPASLAPISIEQAMHLFPALTAGAISSALYDASASDIDVDALLQGYLRELKRTAGQIFFSSPVSALRPKPGGWLVSVGNMELEASVVVNAAGAWADEIAERAGISVLGLQPKRRTAALIEAPKDLSRWPMLLDAGETFYAKPDAGRLLVSPAEETDVVPHDAYADDDKLAEGIARLEELTTIRVRSRPRAWGGLRTFTKDRLPAVGFSSQLAGFFWLAGQGGFGVQTAPAIAAMASSLIKGAPLPDVLLAAGVNPVLYEPGRFN